MRPAMAALTGELIAARLASGLSAEPYEQETERYAGGVEAGAGSGCAMTGAGAL